jgi:hypothetical protein
MCKKDPNAVVDDYLALLDDSLQVWSETVAALPTERLRKQASTDAFLRAAVGWETFLSDWYVAAINRAPGPFVAAIRKQLEDRAPSTWAPVVTFGFGEHPTVEQVVNALDARGRNVTFRDAADLKQRAASDLGPPYFGVVAALQLRDLRVIDAVKAIRDCLAHRSSASVRTMNACLDALSVKEGSLRKGGQATLRLTGIGKYLHGRRTVQGHRRLVAYHNRLYGLAERLRV